MKKRKIVGICSSVGNKAKATNNTYPIIFINRIFIEISHSYNLIPIILSPTVDISEIEQMANMIDFLILTGGEDIHPQFYNEVINYDYYEYNACNPTLERDYFEIQLYSISKSLGKSILGICRGMQIINISEGGTLCQNIDTDSEDLKPNFSIISCLNSSSLAFTSLSPALFHSGNNLNSLKPISRSFSTVISNPS